MLHLADGVAAHSLRERPDLVEAARQLGGVGPQFLAGDITGQFASITRFRTLWPEYSFVLIVADKVVARACSVPFRLDDERPGLPAHGWDGALVRATTDLLDERQPNTICAIDIQISPDHRGRRLSGLAVETLRQLSHGSGMDLVVPVRPPDKCNEPFTPIDEYARRSRNADDLPVDRWLRVHVRAGGEIVGIAPFAMTVTAGLDQWRQWTGQPFDTSGPVVVAGGLVPVIAEVTQDLGVYVEPNIWVRHRCQR